jgi:NAD(P)H-nitrite reductase large subunit
MRIGVIGAGHAGVEAAWRARQAGAEVVLFSNESVLPYFRPRVVALAFGQTELEGIFLRPEKWYREHGLDLRLNCEVVQLDARAKALTADGRAERFDALVIATGAAPALLALGRDLPDDVIELWGVSQSLAIRRHLERTRCLIILGGGISGVEAALYAREAGPDVVLVEKLERLMSQQFGPNAAAVLQRRLQKAGVTILTGRYAQAASKPDDRLRVTLDDGRELIGDLILTTVGAVRPLQLFERAGLQIDRGIVVNEHMQTSVPGIFACGDIAQRDGVRANTVLRARTQGRGAGENAVAWAEGRPPAHVAEPVAPLLFKHRDTEIHSVGPATGANLEERVLTNDGENVYRSVLLENGALRGVQMIGSHEGFRQLADSLGRPWQELDRKMENLA